MGIPWGTIFLFSIHSIWLTRNNFIFKQTTVPISVSVNQIFTRAAELWSCTNVIHSLHPTSIETLISPHSKPPQNAWIKLNAGGSMQNTNLRIGGCFRDEKGLWILGYLNLLARVAFCRQNYGLYWLVYNLQLVIKWPWIFGLKLTRLKHYTYWKIMFLMFTLFTHL